MSNFLIAQIAALLDPITKRVVGFKGTDGVEQLLPGLVQKVTNNAAASLTMSAGKNHLACVGTNVTTLEFVFPAIRDVPDEFVASVYSQAAISVAATFVSTGGTFVNAPSTMTAGQVVRFIKSGTTWLPF